MISTGQTDLSKLKEYLVDILYDYSAIKFNFVDVYSLANRSVLQHALTKSNIHQFTSDVVSDLKDRMLIDVSRCRMDDVVDLDRLLSRMSDKVNVQFPVYKRMLRDTMQFASRMFEVDLEKLMDLVIRDKLLTDVKWKQALIGKVTDCLMRNGWSLPSQQVIVTAASLGVTSEELQARYQKLNNLSLKLTQLQHHSKTCDILILINQ